MKKFVLGLIVGCVISFSIGSFASGVWSKIDVLENDIKIFANGEEVITPSFIYNDTTYVPLRAVSEKANCLVDYDAENKEAHVYNKFNTSDNGNSILYTDSLEEIKAKNYSVFELTKKAENGTFKYINSISFLKGTEFAPKGIARQTELGTEFYDLAFTNDVNGKNPVYYHLFVVFPQDNTYKETVRRTLSDDHFKYYTLTAEALNGKMTYYK